VSKTDCACVRYHRGLVTITLLFGLALFFIWVVMKILIRYGVIL
jgi:hypothetical protein